MKKIMIATGGSGGHIYPALAFATILKEKEPNCEIVFFGSNNHMEKDLIPEAGYRFIGETMHGLRGNVVAQAKAVFSLWKGYRKCITLLKEERPDACVGFGNYISVPLLLAAHRLHIPTMIHEQNSYAGKANHLLGKFVDAIVTSYQTTMSQFPTEKTRLYGNPEATLAVRDEINPSLLASYGIDATKPFIVSMMGSLGSSSVAKVLDESCEMWNPSYQVLLVVGKQNDYQFKAHSPHIHIVPFVDGKQVLKQCALAILRAGATTLCEVTSIGTASILIPSPFVPNNHQVYNAMELVNQKAALLIEEKDLTAKRLADEVNALLEDKQRLEDMKANAKALGKENAAYDMIAWLKELVK